jgi:CO/xanthine dehydrogenase FAD-binding subunit
LTLDAQVELVGPAGTRRLPLGAFVTGVRQTELRPGELLAALHIPDPGPSAGGFVKLGARKYLVISIAMVAAIVRVDSDRVDWARVAVGACSPVARRLPRLEDDLRGISTGALASTVRPDHLEDLSPIGDVRGSAAYRLDAVADLVGRALTQAAKGA